jgi:phosphohistidine swiveling domain-containing protein
MNHKWQKLVARTEDVLHWDSAISCRRQPLEIGEIFWGTKNDLVLKNNVVLPVWYENNPPVEEQTNLGLFCQEKNTDLDTALDDAIATIDQDLTATAVNTLEEAKELYLRFRLDMGLMLFGLVCNTVPIQKLRSELGEERFTKEEELLLRPHRATVIGRESRAIYEVQKEMGQHDTAWLEKQAEALAEEFGYIHSEYVSQSWTTEDYLRALRGQVLAIEDAEALDAGQFSKYGLWLISVVQKLSYLHDEGKSALVRTNWALRATLKNLGEGDDLLKLTEKEFLHWADTGERPSDAELLMRNHYFAILSVGDSYEFFFGKDVVEALAETEGLAKKEVVQEQVIKGTIAFKGKVTGVARIILTQEDSKNLKDGEVLVASMTTPAYIDAMRRAGAFVTDEGGSLCHAAIVAREFKKPCIVGTKSATDMIKDGDLVEVDAETGVVTMLKRMMDKV